MTNKCTLRPCVFIEVFNEPHYSIGWTVGVNITSLYVYRRAFYFYGLEIGLFGRGLFIGVKKICR